MTKVDTGTDRLLAHVEDGIGWVVYNNPDRLNAVSYDMSAAAPRVLAEFAGDPSVRVVVMRGAGTRAFVSGADISEFGARRTAADARAEYDAAQGAAWSAWRGIDKPVIAMIHGYCLGGGLLTALEADIRIADEAAEFAVPAARLGLGFSYEHVADLAGLVGPATTAEMVFSAPSGAGGRGAADRVGEPCRAVGRARPRRALARRDHQRERAAHDQGGEGRAA